MIEQRPEPVAGPGEVLIEVKAVPVTFPDTLMLEDKYQFKAPPPYVPGNEVAGVVIALGEGVTNVAVGDRVVASLGTGGFAQRAAAKASGARKLPDNVGSPNPPA